ncbi:MAG: DUF1849 family protein [Pseudomonadota bacterium]
MPKTHIHIALFAFFAATTLSAQALAVEIKDRATALGFQPHKALYDIKLAGTRSGSQILNISGKMFYEWQPVCDAWVTNHRFNILYEYADSSPMRITSNFSTYEPFDGKTLNFTSQRKRDGDLFEEIRGSASIDEDQAGEAIFTMPTELDFELPEGTLFPMAHSIAVAEKIKGEKKFYNATLFDGSDEDGPVEVNSFIGKPVTPKQLDMDIKAIDKDLLASPARSVRLAFFPLSENEAASDYEMTLVFHDNSLISDMIIEYDDFSVSQTLLAVEPVEDGCKRSGLNE